MDKDFGSLDWLKITVLMENSSSFGSSFLSQHGVAFLIEAGHEDGLSTVLFDSGQSAPPVLNNMKLLGIDINNLDLVFLSHCHHDHTGGLVGILKAGEGRRIPVIAHPLIHRPNFMIKPSFRPVGMGSESSSESIIKAGGEIYFTRDPLPLMPGGLTTGEIIERVDFENNPTISLMTIEEGKMVPDRMVDDISIVFIVNQELVVVTGCSHAGIISIIKTAICLTGIDRIAAVIGGFHLADAGEERINMTVEALAGLNVGEIYTGHCTGFEAEAKMFNKLESRFHKLHTGMCLKF